MKDVRSQAIVWWYLGFAVKPGTWFTTAARSSSEDKDYRVDILRTHLPSTQGYAIVTDRKYKDSIMTSFKIKHSYYDDAEIRYANIGRTCEIMKCQYIKEDYK